MSTALFTMGKLEAMRGRFDDAREFVARSRSILEEVSLPVWVAGPLAQMSGWVEILAGNPAAAERELQAGAKTLQEIGELPWLSTVAGIIAEAVYAQGRYDEVEPWLRTSEEAAGTEDVYSQTLLRGIKAKLLARSGQADEAERLGREAVAIAEPTDFLFMQAFALLSLGEALVTAGLMDRSVEVLNRALAVCERKGFTVGAGRARELLAMP
jgi:tetratricopeptide (TPR) repeat protein